MSLPLTSVEAEMRLLLFAAIVFAGCSYELREPELVVYGNQESITLAAVDLGEPIGAVIMSIDDTELMDVLYCTKGQATIYVDAPGKDLSGSEARLEAGGWDCELTDDSP